MKCIVITVPGMGKTTYAKKCNTERKSGEAGIVDLDYKCPWMEFTPKIKSGNAFVAQEWVDAGYYVIANVNWINLTKLRPDTKVVFIKPKDVEGLKKRIEERDGNRDIADKTEQFITTLNAEIAIAKKRFTGVSEIDADLVSEAFEIIAKMSEEDFKEKGEPEEPSQPVEEPEPVVGEGEDTPPESESESEEQPTETEEPEESVSEEGSVETASEDDQNKKKEKGV